jgi:Caspase domain
MRSTVLAAIVALGLTAALDASAACANVPQSQDRTAAAAATRPAPRRRALLIGVTSYRPDDYRPGDTPYSMMRNLPTACRGVDAISARLQTLGWRYDPGNPEAEVQAFCDVNARDMADLLQRTVVDFDRPDDFLIIYLAGHGAEIEGRNCFFGPTARIDLRLEADRLSRYQQSLLFVGQALELGRTVFDPAGGSFQGNILLILDTCSNDIVYDSLGERLRRPVGAPQTGVPPLGVSVLFAHTPGRRIGDGVGLSHLARAIDELAVPGLRIDAIASNITRRVAEQTRSLPPDQLQQPLLIQILNNTDICLAGCAIFADKGSDSSAAAAGGAKRAAARHDPPASQAAASSPAPARAPSQSGPGLGQRGSELGHAFTVYQRFAADAGGPVVNADIYWCEGTEQGGRAREAEGLATALTGSPFIVPFPDAPEGFVRLGAVRTRALSREENERADLRISGNVARISDGSPHAAAVADRVRSTAMDNLRIEPVRGSSDTMSVYLCAGVATVPQAPRLRVQVAREDQRSLGTLLSADLDTRMENLWVASSVDVVEERSPATTQIRFFYESDRALAERIADAIGQTLAERPRVAYVPYYSGPRVRPGSTELWIGSSVQAAAIFDRPE